MQKARPKQRSALKVKALPKLKVLCTCQRPSNCH
jgi:hypothetical protein